MQEITLAVVLFTLIVIALAMIVLLARLFLVPSGMLEINVNDARDISVRAGDKLLAALSANELFLPSACGARGTCGQCKLTILEGAPPLLPVEADHVTKREAAAGVRLACQVTVNEAMRIEVPEDVFGVNRWQCTVRSNKNVATFIKELVLDLPAGESIDFRAGAYVQIESPPYELSFSEFDIPPEYRPEWDRFDLLKLKSAATKPSVRAYSIASYPAEDTFIMLNVRIAPPPPTKPDAPPGIMSSYLFGLNPGDTVEVYGPYGDFFARESDAEMVFIGGGAGMGPMRSHILDQLLRIGTKRKISFWYGARSLREAFYVEEFDELAARFDNFDWYLALSEPLPEDNWRGLTGFVHEILLEKYLQDHPAPEDCEYYMCGPPVMNAAVVSMLDSQGVDAENMFLDDFGT